MDSRLLSGGLRIGIDVSKPVSFDLLVRSDLYTSKSAQRHQYFQEVLELFISACGLIILLSKVWD